MWHANKNSRSDLLTYLFGLKLFKVCNYKNFMRLTNIDKHLCVNTWASLAGLQIQKIMFLDFDWAVLTYKYTSNLSVVSLSLSSSVKSVAAQSIPFPLHDLTMECP